MIQKIVYMNLDRSIDRNAWFLENMELAGVPMEIVQRVPSRDWQDYDSVEDTLHQMNKESGYAPHILISKHRCTEDNKVPYLRGQTAYLWTVSDVLNSIIDSDAITLVLHDDTSLVSWEDLISSFDGIMPCLHKYYRPLHVIQLTNGRHNWLPNPVIPFNHVWNYGVSCPHEGALVFSYFGASRMLSLIQYNWEFLMNMEKMLYEHFNNYNTFHPIDSNRFVKILDSPRTITDDQNF